ncbi:hypothetical protein STEG23_008757, partial [Scotinomys teguina]
EHFAPTLVNVIHPRIRTTKPRTPGEQVALLSEEEYLMLGNKSVFEGQGLTELNLVTQSPEPTRHGFHCTTPDTPDVTRRRGGTGVKCYPNPNTSGPPVLQLKAVCIPI